ncbi:MAG TPA: sensor histidine kinase [Actinomycetota bacterium]|nr:sensor histidine kinase [Actinomycetota bacterium]
MQRLGVLARRYGFDALIVLASIESLVEVALGHDKPGFPDTAVWAAALIVGLVPLPLLLHRRFPFGAPATMLLVVAALSFVDGRLVVFSIGTFGAGMAAAFLLGNLEDPVRARIGLVMTVAAIVIVVNNDPEHDVGQLVFIPVLFGIVWLAGYAMRERVVRADVAEQRAELAEREREAEALRAVVEERTRIARELHDVVGHSVSVMTVQTSAVRRRLTPEQEAERNALLTVEQTGREALAEMRRVVGALRDPDDAPALAPQPSLTRVDVLVAQANETGLPVDLTIEGNPVPLPAGVDLAAYRVVQEGLTNAIRHAEAQHAEVRVRYVDGHVEVEVTDDGRGAPSVRDAPATGGHGLVGMRERVSIYGGELEAGPRLGGGFRLRARLPLSVPS